MNLRMFVMHCLYGVLQTYESCCSMKTLKVYLNVYDFTDCNSCLGVIGLGGYHTGIQIDNEQYCYCVVSTDPDETGVIVIEPESADYTFNRKLYLGEVSMMGYRFRQIIRDLSEEYTCGKYHMFNLNCNHFTNTLAARLLGSGIPRWLFRSTDLLGWMCCCLPRKLTSGQWALESLLEEDRRREETDKPLAHQI